MLGLILTTLVVPLPAQGGIRWSDSATDRRPVLRVRELALSDAFEFCVPGWTTTGFLPFAGNTDQATAIGINPAPPIGTTRSVGVLARSEGEGSALQPVLFPFARDLNVDTMFVSHASSYQWTGFLAPIGGQVPDYAPAALCYRVEMLSLRPPALFAALDGNVLLGVALANSSGVRTGTEFVVRPSGVRAAAIVDYRFDRGLGNTAVNYAGIAGGASARATLTPGGPASWTTGRFGQALARGSTCDTGWSGDLGGAFTVGWFMHGPAAMPNTESAIFDLGTFRCVTGGPLAMRRLRCTGWGGTPAVLELMLDVQSLAAAGWVHVALVVDPYAAAPQARWYVDGVLQQATAITSRAVIVASSMATMLIGGASNGPVGRYDLDEFRFVAAALSAADVAVWANSSPANAAAASVACGANLRTRGQPTIGNANFELRVEGTPASAVALTLGATGRLFGAIDLPIDLGLINAGLAGCQWHSDATVSIPTALPATGLGDIVLPLPADPALRGLDLDLQALVVEPSLRLRATNAQIVAID
jgi:hypothetical protein